MNNKTYKVLYRYILILCSTILIIYLFINYRKSFMNINIRSLRNYILSFGQLSFFIMLLIFSLKPVMLFFPTVVLTIIAGNLYGPLRGLALTMLGLFFSGTFAFYISKNLGHIFVNKITRKKFPNLEKRVESHGFKIFFLMRISTVFPYDALSYAAGLTSMKYKEFILGSLLGTFPEMIAYSYIGKHVNHPVSKRFIIPIILVFLLGLTGSYLYKNYINTQK